MTRKSIPNSYSWNEFKDCIDSKLTEEQKDICLYEINIGNNSVINNTTIHVVISKLFDIDNGIVIDDVY